MKTLEVSLGERSYPIHIGPGLLEDADRYLEQLGQRRVVIVTNPTVAKHYLEPLQQSLAGADIRHDTITIPDGESYKSWETLYNIHTGLLELRAERGTTAIALGGGVIGDLVGFAAATYQRGMPFIQVPTTLMAQVDSSVGGKTAVNHPLGKNMIGAFYQPRVVLIDTQTLNTLPDRELRAGLAEVIKYGLIRDLAFFSWLENNVDKLLARDSEALSYSIEVCCRSKAEVVSRDERESGERMLLNFGHTFAHAIEAGMGYGSWLHGEAVAAGMLLAAQMSRQLGLIDEQSVARISALLQRAGLLIPPPALGASRYLELMAHDKKAVGGQIRLVLLRQLGAAFTTADYPQSALYAVLQRLGPD